MKIRILKQGEGTLTEEEIYVSEIIETDEKFIFKKWFDDSIIELKKSEIFYDEVIGTFFKN